MIFRNIVLFSVFAILAVAIYSLAATLVTPPEINELKTLDVVSSDVALLDMILKAVVATDDISTVEGKFASSVDGNTTSVTIRDKDGVTLGSGSAVASGDILNVSLSDIVTEAERPNVREVTITVT